MLLSVSEGRSGESERVVGREQADHIEQVLRELIYVGGNDRFVILTDEEREPGNEEYYIQCYFGTPKTGDKNSIDLEYREGSGDKHYRCSNELSGLFGLEVVVRAFVGYLQGKEDWNSGVEWERVTDFGRE